MSRPSSPWFRTNKNAWYVWHEGKQRSLGVRGKENKAEAVRAWHRLMGGLPLQSPTKPLQPHEPLKAEPIAKANGVSVKEVIDGFLADAESRVSPITYGHYEKFCRFFVADCGTFRADVLTLASVEAWARKPTWSQSTRHDALGVLATAFRWAERAGMLSRSPLVGIRKPPKASRGAKALISADEHARLVACADPLFGAFLELLWLTGARPSEIAGLHAEEIDHAQGLVVLTNHKEAHLGKSRVIFLSAEALAIINGIGRKSGLLFPGENGQRMTPQAIGCRLRRLCVRVGVKHCIAYGYRHSFATQALANGVPDAHVAALMGHASTTMLHKHYSHLTARSQALLEALGCVR